MLFLKAFFENQPSGNFKYECDSSDTEIMIVSQQEVAYETIGSTPTISVDESGINAENKTTGYLSDIDFATNTKTYIDMYNQTLISFPALWYFPEYEIFLLW